VEKGFFLGEKGNGASASYLRLGSWGGARVLLVGTSSVEPLDREL
jgi:hypothetical protein